ncbi:Amino acid transporter transmembrane domain [Trinorchestia longiramus]|nr:Amino acid transporter transmembrane domain [Trinorchestia longiramus]
MSSSLEDREPSSEKDKILQAEIKSYNNEIGNGGSDISLVATNKYGSSQSLVSSDTEQSVSVWSSFSAHVNYINAVTGSSMIAMPFVLREAGLILGGALIMLVALITAVSLVLQINAGRAVRANTYQETTEVLFGWPGFVICGLLQFAVPFFSMMSYNVVVGDSLPKVFMRMGNLEPGHILLNRELIITMMTLGVTLPLSCFRNIKSLAHSSFVSIGILIIIGVCISVRASAMRVLEGMSTGGIALFAPHLGPAQAIVTFGFCIHQVSFTLYRSLDESRTRWNRTTYTSMFASAGLCLFIGLGGYCSFGKLTQGDVLENYCYHDDLMNVMRGLFVMTVLFTYPSECFAAREVIETTFFRERQPPTAVHHYGITFILVLLAMFLSFTTKCLAFVLLLTGLFFSCPLAFILPSLLSIKARKEEPTMSLKNISALLLLVFSVVVEIAGIVTIVVDYDTVSTCSGGQQMHYCYTEVNGTEVQIAFPFLSLSPSPLT